MKATGLSRYIKERKNDQELKQLRIERLIADFLAIVSEAETDTERSVAEKRILQLIQE